MTCCSHKFSQSLYFLNLVCITNFTSELSYRVRVVSAGESSRAPTFAVSVDDTHYRPIRSGHHQKCSQDNQSNTPNTSSYPTNSLSPIISFSPIIVKPHGPHRLHAHDGTKQCADKRNQGIKSWDCASNNPRNDCYAKGAAEPTDPVYWRIAGEVPRASQCVNEYEFGWNLGQTVISIRSWLVFFAVLTWVTIVIETNNPGMANA